jgi:hypothetical protein
MHDLSVLLEMTMITNRRVRTPWGVSTTLLPAASIKASANVRYDMGIERRYTAGVDRESRRAWHYEISVSRAHSLAPVAAGNGRRRHEARRPDVAKHAGCEAIPPTCGGFQHQSVIARFRLH